MFIMITSVKRTFKYIYMFVKYIIFLYIMFIIIRTQKNGDLL